jgi:peroxiredoxin
MRLFVAVCLAGLFGGCASGPSAAPPKAAQLTLSLARADGRTVELSAYGGQPLLLVLFATYDEASQLALVKLTKFLSQHASVQVAGVLMQPDAATFLPLFKDAVSLPFEVYYDPDQRILSGASALGKLNGVPAFVALDATGHIRDIRYGVQSSEELEQLTNP